MEKVKLRSIRNLKDLSQQDMAILANMDQTTYGRKENGISKITCQEWKRFASILDVPLKDLFEDGDNGKLPEEEEIDCLDKGKEQDTKSDIVPSHVLEILKNYIQKLEAENKQKEDQIIALRAELQVLKG